MNIIEEWKDITNHEGSYGVSNKGNVYSLKTNKMLKLVPCAAGYFRVTLCKNGTYTTKHVHILVAEMFIMKKPSQSRKYWQVNHIDGNKLNNNLDNLEYCTAKENSNHAIKLGLRYRKPNGEYPKSKLTVKQVKDIRKRIKTGEKQKDIAKIYKIQPSAVSAISRGLVWSWLK